MKEIERIECRLKLQDLRVLISVVKSGSMHKAAERLRTSQPAVSRAIADLEQAVGVRLLDRSPHGIEPRNMAAHLSSEGSLFLTGFGKASKTSNFSPTHQRESCG